MDDAQMIETLLCLAEGTDPVTGEVFPPDSPYQHPRVIRSLYRAVLLLRAGASGGPPAPVEVPAAKRVPFRSSKPGQGRTGQRWAPEETDRLAAAWDSGSRDIRALAQEHGRSTGAIRSRLVLLGRMTLEDATAANQQDRAATGDAPEGDEG